MRALQVCALVAATVGATASLLVASTPIVLVIAFVGAVLVIGGDLATSRR